MRVSLLFSLAAALVFAGCDAVGSEPAAAVASATTPAAKSSLNTNNDCLEALDSGQMNLVSQTTYGSLFQNFDIQTYASVYAQGSGADPCGTTSQSAFSRIVAGGHFISPLSKVSQTSAKVQITVNGVVVFEREEVNNQPGQNNGQVGFGMDTPVYTVNPGDAVTLTYTFGVTTVQDQYSGTVSYSYVS